MNLLLIDRKNRQKLQITYKKANFYVIIDKIT
jgi:hypothetical protein